MLMSECQFILKSFGHSDVGLVRNNNEDVFLQVSRHNFFALADGMGGHKAGEVAAQETVVYLSSCIEKMFKFHKESSLDVVQIKDNLSHYIEHSNTRIYQLGKENDSYKGMGTTLCSLLFYRNRLIRAHVGDSRIYLYRNNTLTQLTYDHTLYNKLIMQGKLEEAIEKGIRYKNVLTRAIGAYKSLTPEISLSVVEPEDLYLMCSDGLSDYVTDEEISCILDAETTLKEKGLELIARAKSKKSSDNITVLLTQVE
ncbi:serine/threonine protein phosphatase [Candidatus Aerophobetes bacterium]|uniref:Serine/threonine protein phosphatase n=1 Tax=Aerophobetes bacterium TaxID=2030807 RepID=A0A2A4YD30_UNCAE|nr:MAG: serine/threonine protein phosphatase [Candidatus Aerophobetes bacterium]